MLVDDDGVAVIIVVAVTMVEGVVDIVADVLKAL